MNIYDMLDWIRKNGLTAKHIYVADFLNDQYMSGSISSETLFYMYRDIMFNVLNELKYGPQSMEKGEA